MNSKTLARLLADRDRLARENERLREALEAFGWLFQWCQDHAPAALEEMPTPLYRITRRLAAGEQEGVVVKRPVVTVMWHGWHGRARRFRIYRTSRGGVAIWLSIVSVTLRTGDQT